MRSLVRWEPYSDLVSLRDAMDRLFEESVVRPRGRELESRTGGRLAIDMYEENDNVVVKAAIPGAKAEDIDVSINGDVLTIKGETKSSEEIEEENYIYREQRYGSFSRSVGLPANVNTEDAEADFEDGILTLTMPKLEEAKPRQISVKSKGEDE